MAKKSMKECYEIELLNIAYQCIETGTTYRGVITNITAKQETKIINEILPLYESRNRIIPNEKIVKRIEILKNRMEELK